MKKYKVVLINPEIAPAIESPRKQMLRIIEFGSREEAVYYAKLFETDYRHVTVIEPDAEKIIYEYSKKIT